jgi:peptide/nickel transport system substrate-binding protein
VRHVLVRLLGRLRRPGHRRHRTPALAALALLAPAALAGAVVGAPSAARAADPVIFTVAYTDEVDSLNPFLGYQAVSYDMWAMTYDMMVGYSMKDASPIPQLATSWDTSDDGKTWTFHIRSGVTWSDGQPFTAADIAYTYNRVLTGKVEANNWGSYLANVDTVTAPDDKTVVLSLSTPNATLPLLPIPIVPEHIWKDVSAKDVKSYAAEPSDGHPVVGTGPFQPVEGTAGGSTFRFVANKDYWGGKPNVDEIDVKIYKSDDPAVQALIKGEVDFVEDITPLQVQSLEGKAGITAHNGLSPVFEEIGFNTGAVDTDTGQPIGDGNPALLDPKFRHALGYAVDTDRVVKTAYQGAADPGSTIVPAEYGGWHWTPPDDEALTFDLDKAGQLLDDAGYTKGADGKRTMPDGSPLGTLRLYARADAKASVDTMDLFKGWLGELGIDAEVKAMDSNTLGDKILDGTYDAFQWDWYVEPDPDGILADFTCDQRGGLSDSWYCDEGYDQMYADQKKEVDHDKRVEIVKAMQQQLYEQSPYIVTAYTTTGEAIRNDRFACFQPQPDPGGVWLYQWGGRNFTLLRPAKGAGDCDGITSAVGASAKKAESGGSSTATLAVGGGVLAVLVVVGAVVLLRRRSTASDRE